VISLSAIMRGCSRGYRRLLVEQLRTALTHSAKVSSHSASSAAIRVCCGQLVGLHTRSALNGAGVGQRLPPPPKQRGLSDPVLDAIAATANNTGRTTRAQICRTHRGERATAECCGHGASADQPWSPTVSDERASICSPTGAFRLGDFSRVPAMMRFVNCTSSSWRRHSSRATNMNVAQVRYSVKYW
jgi:hypothetical protein